MKKEWTPWGFRKAGDRAEAERIQDEENPDWVIGSPPCAGFSQFNWVLNFHTMDPSRVKEMLDEARTHLHIMIRM